MLGNRKRFLTEEMNHNPTCLTACETLLREHLTAIPIYQKFLASSPPSSRKDQLERILASHGKSVTDLRATLVKLGMRARSASASSHPPCLAGACSLLDLLRQEEAALEKSEILLQLRGLSKEAFQCIRDTVIPRFQKNIAILERLQESVLVELPAG